MIIRFTALGRPRPQGSKRAIGNGRMVEMSPHVKLWRATVDAAARVAMHRTGTVPFDGPVRVSIRFGLGRPRSHYRSGRYAHLIKDSAPAHHTYTPDVDKLSRAVMDALTTSGLIRDDSFVRSLFAEKVWVGHGEDRADVVVRDVDTPLHANQTM